MRFSLAVAALTPVLSVYAADILVQVGAGGKLAFSPQNITAAVGDTIAFQFQGKNHSVTQSTFANPCAIQTTPAQGIDSGFQAVPANATQLPEWSFTVNNASAPLWFFCAQTTPANHCAAGMVFSVNANEASPKNFAAYQAAAMGGNAAAAGGAPSGAPSAPGGAGAGASSIASDAAGAIGGAAATATSVIGGIAGDATAAAGAAATDAANAITGLLGGGASPTVSAGAAGNSTAPNSAGRIGSGAMSLVAVVGLTAGMLL